MKERPILFSAPMVRAIMDGSKTMTRRVVKPKYNGDLIDIVEWREQSGRWFGLHEWSTVAHCVCPYGQIGDRLWVRETFCVENTYDYHGDHEVPHDGRPIKKFEGDGDYWLIPHYFASESEPHIVPYRCDADDDRTRWKPSIHMPRWASRITLEITDVRVERLQDISRGDAMEEGCPFPNMAKGDDPRKWFADLWHKINGHDSWAGNPWVWVVEFKVVA